MKRVLQLVALIVGSLLTTQPVLCLPCPMGAAETGCCAPGCTMAMSQMGTVHQISAHGCVQDCCQQVLPQAIARLQVRPRAKISGAASFIVALPAVAGAELGSSLQPPGVPHASEPARYLLFRVFRI
jgi:hypothetical protein